MGFSTKNIKWTEVEAAGTSRMLPAGGYVAVITDVEDVESKEYLRFTYDIAEGELKGFFEDDDRKYTHQFTRSYKDTAMAFMKKFLDAVEASNKDFDLSKWNNDPTDLIGKCVGIIVQREDYTNQNGEDRARMNVEEYAKADDIRKGRYVLPEPKDTRASKPESVPSPYSTADVPF